MKKPKLKIATLSTNSKGQHEERIARIEKWMKHHTIGACIILSVAFLSLLIFRKEIMELFSYAG